MELLNDENKLQVYKKNENWKSKTISLRTNNIVNFNTIRNKLSALSNIINWILIQRLMKPVSILRLHEEFKKKAKTANSKKIHGEKCRVQKEKNFWYKFP